jgi:ABC-type amino acid transport substrate-binding protein
LERGRLDAFVYDRPILGWLIRTGNPRSVELADVTFGPQDYAIALPNRSELRKRVDIALLGAVQSDWWRENLVHHLGRAMNARGDEP